MLIIKGCVGANIEGISCTHQIELPIVEEHSGHRFLKFCKCASECRLQLSMVLSQKENPETMADQQQFMNDGLL